MSKSHEVENNLVNCCLMLRLAADVCSSDPCQNGGTCTSPSYAPNIYWCICPNGYIGPTCAGTYCTVLKK